MFHLAVPLLWLSSVTRAMIQTTSEIHVYSTAQDRGVAHSSEGTGEVAAMVSLDGLYTQLKRSTWGPQSAVTHRPNSSRHREHLDMTYAFPRGIAIMRCCNGYKSRQTQPTYHRRDGNTNNLK